MDKCDLCLWNQGSGGGGGGSSTLSGLTDVDISNPTDGQTLVYNSASGKWENGEGGGGGFTLLHGTYSYDQEEEKPAITLPCTASELYALVRSSSVAYDCTVGGEGNSNALVSVINRASLSVKTGYADTYTFSADNFATAPLEATDTVVLVLGGK